MAASKASDLLSIVGIEVKSLNRFGVVAGPAKRGAKINSPFTIHDPRLHRSCERRLFSVLSCGILVSAAVRLF